MVVHGTWTNAAFVTKNKKKFQSEKKDMKNFKRILKLKCTVLLKVVFRSRGLTVGTLPQALLESDQNELWNLRTHPCWRKKRKREQSYCCTLSWSHYLFKASPMGWCYTEPGSGQMRHLWSNQKDLAVVLINCAVARINSPRKKSLSSTCTRTSHYI